MGKRKVIIGMVACFCLFGSNSVAFADSAEVLPKGVFSLNAKYSYYLPVTKRFDEDGKEEDLANDFNATLDSSVFPDLELIEMGFGLPSGSASLGDSVVDFEYHLQDLKIRLNYGLLDKLSVGIEIPYYWNRNDVNAFLDTTNATVGLNPFVPGGVAPLAIPGTRPFTTEDVQKLLGQGLDTNGDGNVDIPGFGFKRFEDYNQSGLSDIQLGLRYQYLNKPSWRLAFEGGVRCPTGKIDDPDSLTDIPFGSGAWALLFRLNNDFTGVENLILNATLKYDLTLPDRVTLRVPDDPNRPITANKEKVSRNQGDKFEIELSGIYQVFKALSFSLLYDYSFSTKDSISGNKGFAYDSLEEESDWTAHYFTVGLTYSTIPLYVAKKFPLPMTASIEYENWFAGSNNILKQQLFNFKLNCFF